MTCRIAFFTTDWNYEIGTSSLHGVQNFLNEYPDTSVFVFDCFGRYNRTNNDKGEFEIFQLPDLAAFDGMVIQTNQILPQEIQAMLVQKGKEAGIPILSLNDELDGCLFVGTDNYSAMKQLVNHLIDHHHLARLSFVAGYPESHEAQERRRAFYDACREAGLRTGNIHEYPGYWEYEQGADAARQILRIQAKNDRPEALVCANDEMAIGACETFLAAGLRIPEDIIVTGFDNIGTAASFTPRLTTVSREYDAITKRGLETIRREILGEQSDPELFSASSLIFSESCGCGTTSPEEDARTKKRFFDMNQLMKYYYARQSDMTAEMFDAETFSDIYDQFEKSAGMLGCPHVYLCVSSSEIENHAENSHKTSLDEEMSLVGIYAANPENEISEGKPDHPDSLHVYGTFPKEALLPSWAQIDSRLAIFYPLHYKEYCFGYIVLDGISPAGGINLIEATFTFIETALENVRKKYLLKDLNDKLSGLYVKDSLTGLYNRFGMEEYGRKQFGMISDLGGSAEILFIDMDNMKEINDAFGHKTGDQALRAVADILRGVFGKTENAFLMRFGGDEFIVICPDDGTRMEKRIQEAASEFNLTKGLPFQLNLSIGTAFQKEKERPSLDSLIQLADSRMYEEKKRHKAGR